MGTHESIKLLEKILDERYTSTIDRGEKIKVAKKLRALVPKGY